MSDEFDLSDLNGEPCAVVLPAKDEGGLLLVRPRDLFVVIDNEESRNQSRLALYLNKDAIVDLIEKLAVALRDGPDDDLGVQVDLDFDHISIASPFLEPSDAAETRDDAISVLYSWPDDQAAE